MHYIISTLDWAMFVVYHLSNFSAIFEFFFSVYSVNNCLFLIRRFSFLHFLFGFTFNEDDRSLGLQNHGRVYIENRGVENTRKWAHNSHGCRRALSSSFLMTNARIPLSARLLMGDARSSSLRTHAKVPSA